MLDEGRMLQVAMVGCDRGLKASAPDFTLIVTAFWAAGGENAGCKTGALGAGAQRSRTVGGVGGP